MSDWQFFSEEDGVKTYYQYDASEGKNVFKTVQDVEPLLDLNRRALNQESGNWKGDMHHVASIPAVLYMEWWREFGGNPMLPENKPKLMRKLMDRDFSKLRVKSGSL